MLNVKIAAAIYGSLLSGWALGRDVAVQRLYGEVVHLSESRIRRIARARDSSGNPFLPLPAKKDWNG